ncbi:peptide chain release factor N(5)-glutamine methyltransferase [Rhabdothermincola salaria]|uniref:peptide chain release factor N(5)-glutamine methyltransferase n=1 Tax=Rhabdothermincola salaria TaxID=2903142 RepID=UPI001E2ACAA1|nr:peptide chain release factor N(5)-glutamine methyltransferase [Rhabdothermincola salaria]MCD9625062.1 peptide chain release factor N(5)-glutamine methyltransferase [Rhabdothermincola salaria]
MAGAPEGTVSWRQLRAEARRRLADAGPADSDPVLDARCIVERASGFEGAELVLGLDEPATERGVHFFDLMLERRLRGEPLQYVLGRWGFRTLDLFVDARVLIPRPETETVVDVALAELDRSIPAARHEGRTPCVVDLGTGSGAIALSVAVERRTVEVWATDASSEALEVARANLAGLGAAAARIRLTEGSWFEALPTDLAGTVDLLVSNPPYVADGDELPAVVRDWEPAGALFAGSDGLDDIRHIVADAPRWLAAEGSLVVELAPDQADVALALASAAGLVEARIAVDLAGRARALVARRS